MPRPLDGVRAKIRRAKDHLRNLHEAIRRMAFSKEDTPPAGHQYEPDRQELIVTLPKIKPFDPSLPLIVGDCIHIYVTLSHDYKMINISLD